MPKYSCVFNYKDYLYILLVPDIFISKYMLKKDWFFSGCSFFCMDIDQLDPFNISQTPRFLGSRASQISSGLKLQFFFYGATQQREADFKLVWRSTIEGVLHTFPICKDQSYSVFSIFLRNKRKWDIYVRVLLYVMRACVLTLITLRIVLCIKTGRTS